MSNLVEWVEANRFQLDENSAALMSEGAMELDSLKGTDSLSNHITGRIHNEIFEMIDKTTQSRNSNGGYSETHQTLILLPNSCAGIPNFELIPGAFARFLSFIGHGGIIFNLADQAQRSSKEMIAQFSSHYKLFPGGVIESGLHSRNPMEHDCDSVDDIAMLCKHDFFSFFNKNPNLLVEVQNDHLMIHESNKILSPRERSAALERAVILRKLLYTCHRDQPIRGLSLGIKAFEAKAIFGKFALVAGLMFIIMAMLIVSTTFWGPRAFMALPIIILIAGGIIFKMIFKAKK